MAISQGYRTIVRFSSTLCSRPFALSSVSRRKTAVQGQMSATHVRFSALKLTNTIYLTEFFELKT